MKALKEWSEDAGEMSRIQGKVSAFVIQLILDGDIPQEVYMEATTSPMTIAGAMKGAMLKALRPTVAKNATVEEEALDRR